MKYQPLKDEAGLTLRGIAFKLAEIGYWSWVDYGNFCSKNNIYPV